MAVLSNPKHELFAQEIAKGTDCAAAYTKSGFKPNAGNARTLRANQAVSTRIQALLAEREEIHSQATAAAVEKAGLTKQWIIERLQENVQRAMQVAVVRDGEGNPIGEYKYEGSVANRALELLGKEIGMFVDRKEIRTGELDDVNADELRTLRSLLISAEEGGSSRASQPGARAKPH